MDICIVSLALSFVLFVFWIVWLLAFADTDLTLALAERFGKPVSVYRRKVIWVTGASSGLGEAMAYELASVGAKLILSARNKTRLEQVKIKCLELAQGKLDNSDILVLSFDIADLGVHSTMVKDAVKHFGQVDVLINNAGRGQFGAIKNIDTEVVQYIFQVNVFGTINLTKIVLNHFLDKGSGDIVVITSSAGKHAFCGMASYASAKHALHGYFETLRMEHCKDNIHVTIVCPCFFDSDMSSNLMSTKKGEISHDVIKCHTEMKTSRCAYLALVAGANQLYQVWIAYQPFLAFLYLSQYIPGWFTRVFTYMVTKRTIDEMRERGFPSDFPVWRPFFR